MAHRASLDVALLLLLLFAALVGLTTTTATATATATAAASAGRLSHLHRLVAAHLQRRSKTQQVPPSGRQDGQRDVEFRKMVRWPFHLNEVNNLNNMVEEEPPFNVERFSTDAEQLGYKEPPQLKPGQEGRDLVVVDTGGTNCKASDMLLILDLSTSLDATEMAALKKFAVEMIEGFDLKRALSDNGVRFGVLGFSMDTKMIAPFSADKMSLESSIDQMTAMGVGSGVDKGLAAARLQFDQANRQGGRKMYILVTDASLGSSTESALRESKLLKTPVSELYILGVGSQIDHDSLRSMASDPIDKHIFFVGAYADLVPEIGDFTSALCSGGA